MRFFVSKSALFLAGFLSVAAIGHASLAAEVMLGKRGIQVLVWKNGDAMSEGFSLIQAGMLKTNPTLVAVLLSCIVPPGTRAIITDAGFATHTVLIIDGDSTGCRGDVVMEDVESR